MKNRNADTLTRETRLAKSLCGDLSKTAVKSLEGLISRHKLSLIEGDLKYLYSGWYVTHSGLLRLAERRHCAGMHVHPVLKSSDPSSSRWVFKAVVYKSRTCRGFIGYGDADPSNTSDLVRGAEMRVAETRAVNRALRKAYGIGICSLEEIGSFSRPPAPEGNNLKRPPQSVNGNGANGQHRLRDRLCQLIRQHELDPVLVKSYAVGFCGVKTLKEASREQVKNFIDHVADWATKDKNALVCQLNSYLSKQEVVA
ncbi:MAG TPA: hypothetical protein VJQ82_13670 [Terriglobales bacterium]|nr:hypothetical protein [Terriglobales bacterium]